MGTIAYIVALTSQLTAGAMLLLGSTGISKKSNLSIDTKGDSTGKRPVPYHHSVIL